MSPAPPSPAPTREPACWLLKSEPEVFSYADLLRAGREPWNGVRNYQARNFLRQMRVGDRALFYHSNARPAGIAGVALVVGAAVPDDLQFDPASAYHDPASPADNPRWSMVTVAPLLALPRVLTLDELRALPGWQDSPLTRRGSRLSVLPVTPDQLRAVLRAVGLNESGLGKLKLGELESGGSGLGELELGKSGLGEGAPNGPIIAG